MGQDRFDQKSFNVGNAKLVQLIVYCHSLYYIQCLKTFLTFPLYFTKNDSNSQSGD